jgi:deazaflavin-dependent oxidoreductase (nitroreductase family)
VADAVAGEETPGFAHTVLVDLRARLRRSQHPAWYHNLCADPTAAVTVGGVSRHVRAREATREERERLWQRDLEVYPGWAAGFRPACGSRPPAAGKRTPPDVTPWRSASYTPRPMGQLTPPSIRGYGIRRINSAALTTLPGIGSPAAPGQAATYGNTRRLLDSTCIS